MRRSIFLATLAVGSLIGPFLTETRACWFCRWRCRPNPYCYNQGPGYVYDYGWASGTWGWRRLDSTQANPRSVLPRH